MGLIRVKENLKIVMIVLVIAIIGLLDMVIKSEVIKSTVASFSLQFCTNKTNKNNQQNRITDVLFL